MPCNYIFIFRMLGYEYTACAVTTVPFGTATSSSIPFWMSYVQCNGTEDALDHCSFGGWGEDAYYCRHDYHDAGVVCMDGKC